MLLARAAPRAGENAPARAALRKRVFWAGPDGSGREPLVQALVRVLLRMRACQRRFSRQHRYLSVFNLYLHREDAQLTRPKRIKCMGMYMHSGRC